MQAIFDYMNTPDASVAIVGGDVCSKRMAMREFIVHATRHSMRTLLVEESDGERNASAAHFHSVVTGKPSFSPVVYDLGSGGTIRCMSIEDSFPDYVPDVLVVSLRSPVTPEMAWEWCNLDFKRKLIILAPVESTEYLGLYVQKYVAM